MSFRRRYLLTILLATLATATATVADVVNGGFEDNGGSLIGWTTFNNSIPNVLAEQTTPYSGSHVAKVFGGFNGEGNASGMLQSVPALPGQLWEARAHLRHNSDDSLVGTPNYVVMKIEYYRVFGGSYGTPDMISEHAVTVLDSGSPLDQWQLHTLEVVAPTETVEARIALVFLQFADAGGAALIDDVDLTTSKNVSEIEWDLIWQDEFDGSAIDDSKWRVEDLHLIKNNELQYYAPDDAYLENGNLVLRSQERTYQGFDSDGVWGTYDYTSGLVESKDRFATVYGRVEVRAKLPATQGIWPAHWSLPDSREWPPEIDFMELLGHEPNRVYMTHHWGNWPAVQSNGGSFTGPDFSADFHTFAVEWFPGRIDWYIDDLLRFSSGVSTPQEPFYLILNTAVGGNWPGNPDGTTVFPQYHEIDYVRVYVPSDPGDGLFSIADSAAPPPVVDGAINSGEYAAELQGINNGFGGIIGEDCSLHIDADSPDSLHMAIRSTTVWPAGWSGGVVIYLDTEDGGFASTYELTDSADSARQLASAMNDSGERCELFFASGFRADYAIVVEPDTLSVFALATDSLQLLNGALAGSAVDFNGTDLVQYENDDGSDSFLIRELALPLSLVGAQSGSTVRFVATSLNTASAFRSNEFVAVATGNPWDSSNIGSANGVLKNGDFANFAIAGAGPAAIPAVSTWGLIVMTLLMTSIATIVLISATYQPRRSSST